MTVLIIGHACCNSASWSCANGWPSSVNTFISCRLTAAAVEQKTSSGMNQMKEQIIPSSPWMTCSSDPESVFASLASLKALLPKCGIGKSVRVCVLSGYPKYKLFFSRSLLALCECQNHRTNNKQKLKLNLQELMYSIFPLNLRAEAQAALLLSLSPVLPLLRLWSSICSCFPMCLSQRLLADLALT